MSFNTDTAFQKCAIIQSLVKGSVSHIIDGRLDRIISLSIRLAIRSAILIR